MIRWCSYCQQFQGEVIPYEDLAITHGICKSCSARGMNVTDSEMELLRNLKALQTSLWHAGMNNDKDSAARGVAQALKMNVRPIDILMGLLSPLLYQIGADWAVGKVTVADQHRFSAFSESVLKLVKPMIQKTQPSNASMDVSETVDILLVNAEGNDHSLGIRILELFLQCEGVHAIAAPEALRTDEIKDLVARVRPKSLGISVSLVDQTPSVLGLVEAVGARANRLPNGILLGGAAVKQNLLQKIPGTTLVSDMSCFHDLAMKIRGQNTGIEIKS